MNNLILLEGSTITNLSTDALRALTPIQTFLYQLNDFVIQVLNFWLPTIINTIINEPLFMFPVGFIALMGVVGILSRLLSRD